MSTYSLIALVVMSLWRARLRIRYEIWHFTHILLAVVAIVAGMIHMIGWGFYLGDPGKRALWIGLSIFWICLLLYVRIVKPSARAGCALRGPPAQLARAPILSFT